MVKQNTVGIPVVIVGGSLNALGVVRSLSQEKVPIFVMETSRLCPCAWSRLCQFIPVSSLEGRLLIQALGTLALSLGQRAVLILTDDRAVETVSNFREEVEQHYQLSLPTKEMVKRLADKGSFQEFAEEVGLPVPRSVILNQADDLSLLDSLSLPLVLKPSNKAYVLNGYAERAEYFHSISEAKAGALQILKAAGSAIAQEWVDGP